MDLNHRPHPYQFEIGWLPDECPRGQWGCVPVRRIGARLGSSATAGEGTQNLLCAYLAMAVFAGLAANT
jgi:hypothetical protein